MFVSRNKVVSKEAYNFIGLHQSHKGSRHLGKNFMIKKCKLCGKPFTAIRSNQKYCSSRCANIYYDNQLRKGHIPKKRRRTYPFFHCPACGLIFRLNFSPLKNYSRFKEITCPDCGFKNDPEPLEGLQTDEKVLIIKEDANKAHILPRLRQVA